MRTLNELKTGEYAKVMTIGGEGELRQHLLDMGLIPGVKVRLIKRAPMGDPLEVL
ncbi:MAG: FeoA domain-containing protein, partial [Erysipelotrichaceae bacterium]|nr:FeoA domain-containing protein [Erysipelotrichaceae bacterium]